MKFTGRAAAFLTGLIACLLFSVAASADVNFNAEMDRTRLFVGERASLTIVLEGEGVDARRGVDPPEVEPFFEIMNQIGPQVRTSMEIINGKFTSTSSWSLTYILKAKRAGIFQIPEIAQRVGDKVYRTKPIVVEIVEPPELQSKEEEGWSPPQDPYLEVKVDKPEVFVGEQIVVTWYLYYSGGIYNLKLGSRPALTDFKAEEMETAKQLNPQIKIFNGTSYNVAFIQSMALFPLLSGKATIGPMELIYGVPSSQRDFFGGRIMHERSLSSSPVSITVLPLPEQGKPDNFHGAVGQYSIEAALENKAVRAQDSISLSVTVKGTGNIEFIKAPDLKFPASIEVYPPESETEKTVSSGKLIGGKIFKYILVPQKQGDFNLPGAALTYFDPSQAQYVTIETPELHLHVEQAIQRAAGPVAISPDMSREEIKLIKSDLRYIKQDKTSLKQQGQYLAASKIYLAFHAVPLLALAAAYYTRKRRDRLAADPVFARRRQALPLAKKRLKRAAKKLDGNTAPEFYAELYRALTSYFADRFQVEAPGLTTEAVEKILKEKNIPRECSDLFRDLLSRCDMARFGAEGADANKMKACYNDASRVISEMEKCRQ